MLSSASVKITAIGCSCVMTARTLLITGVHDVSRIDHAQADAAVDREK
jgi:hypothetical protein